MTKGHISTTVHFPPSS